LFDFVETQETYDLDSPSGGLRRLPIGVEEVFLLLDSINTETDEYLSHKISETLSSNNLVSELPGAETYDFENDSADSIVSWTEVTSKFPG